MIALPDRAVAPQLFSRDYLIRVRAPQLEQIVFDHLFTVQDDTILLDCEDAVLRAGYTEWQGHSQGGLVSLAWDWMELADGALKEVTAVAPRSNLRLVDAKGYDLPGAEAAALWDVIRGHDWQAPARQALARLEQPAGPFQVGAPRARQ